jgi:hypothetical protein
LNLQHTKFGGGLPETLLHQIVLVAMIAAIVLVFVLPRKYVLVPVLLFAFLTPLGQEIYFAGVHWFVLRIVILAGWARMGLLRLHYGKNLYAGEFNSIDQAFVAFAVCQAVATVLLYQASGAVINQAGYLIDTVGAYLLLRCMIRNRADIYRALKVFAFLVLVLAIGMVIEQVKLINLFGMLQGVQLTPDIRGGRIRSQGVFQHSLMAGAFAATLVPLFFLLWKNGRAKLAAVTGFVGATVMTIAAQGSTPLLGYAAGILGVCAWPIRRKMRTVRWGIVAALAILALVMKAPVWFVITHIDLTGSSSGYHRAIIVDQFIRNFSDWWVLGAKDLSKWGYDAWDVQNQYVNVGVTGGLAAFSFFLLMITRACARLGRARRKLAGTSKEWLIWFLGATLFAHLVTFFGVNYYDQSKVAWFALLAMITAATLQPQPSPKTTAEFVLVQGQGSGRTLVPIER